MGLLEVAVRKTIFINAFLSLFAYMCGYVKVSFAVNLTEYPRVDKKIAEYDASLCKMRSDFSQIVENINDVHWVEQKLEFMVETDQFMRDQIKWPKIDRWTDAERQYFWQLFFPRWSELDRVNTEDLKKLLKVYRWFTVTQFGAKSDQNAWLIVQHADLDVSFQKNILIILADLYPQGETSPKNYGYLYDRVAMNEKTPQRYGTQGECRAEGWVPVPEIEDFENVDKRRFSLGMNSFAENKQRMDRACAEIN